MWPLFSPRSENPVPSLDWLTSPTNLKRPLQTFWGKWRKDLPCSNGNKLKFNSKKSLFLKGPSAIFPETPVFFYLNCWAAPHTAFSSFPLPHAQSLLLSHTQHFSDTWAFSFPANFRVLPSTPKSIQGFSSTVSFLTEIRIPAVKIFCKFHSAS